jgi:hypothetical protein
MSFGQKKKKKMCSKAETRVGISHYPLCSRVFSADFTELWRKTIILAKHPKVICDSVINVQIIKAQLN